MNRRTYLQTLGAAVGTATLASTGAVAAEGDGVPEAVRQAPVGASDARVADTPADAIDVRDHGAQLDGSTDDRDAIQSALDEAAQSGTPDTVFIPEGPVRMSTALRFYEKHSGVTLQGSGSGTHLRLDQGLDKNHRLVYVRGEGGGVTDLTVRDLRLDGQGAGQNDWMGWGVVTYDDGDNSNILFENLWVHDWAGTNIQIASKDTTVRHVSSWGAKKKQGIATHGGTSSQPIAVERSHFYDNSVHGLNAAQGHARIRNVLSEGNGWGAKNTKNADSCMWENVAFRNNDHHGYMIPVSTDGEITFDNAVAEENGWSGFRFNGNSTVQIKTIAARANDSTGKGDGNVFIGGSMEVDADTIYSFDSYTSGLVFYDYDNELSGSIETYVHGDNEKDTVRGTRGDLSLGTVKPGGYPDFYLFNGESV